MLREHTNAEPAEPAEPVDPVEPAEPAQPAKSAELTFHKHEIQVCTAL